MKFFRSAMTAAVDVAFLPPLVAEDDGRFPNILFILSDDQGYGDQSGAQH